MISEELCKKGDYFWRGKLVITCRDITNRGNKTIPKGTFCKVSHYTEKGYNKGFHISTDDGTNAIVVIGVQREDLDYVE